MLVRKIKYTDYNDVEREEDFYFNLNKAEIIKWLTTNGNYTLDAVLEKMIRTENAKDLVNEFDSLIMMSYGERSLDGKRFIKSQEVKDAFRESEAYSNLFMELISDSDKAAEFFNKIIPKELAEEVSKMITENPDQVPDIVKEHLPNKNNEPYKVLPMRSDTK